MDLGVALQQWHHERGRCGDRYGRGASLDSVRRRVSVASALAKRCRLCRGSSRMRGRVLPFRHIPRLSFLSGRGAGDRWALLPSAAGFVDPLLSTGFPLTLLGVERLARDPRGGTRIAASSARSFWPTRRRTTRRDPGDGAADWCALREHGQLSRSSAPSCLLYFAAASYPRRLDDCGKPSWRSRSCSTIIRSLGRNAERCSNELACSGAQGADATNRSKTFGEQSSRSSGGLEQTERAELVPVDAADLLAGCARRSTRAKRRSRRCCSAADFINHKRARLRRTSASQCDRWVAAH